MRGLRGQRRLTLLITVTLALGIGVNTAMLAIAIAAEGAETLELDFARVTPGFFEALGMRLRLGRSPTDEEVAAGLPLVVLSHAFWSDRLGGDPAVLTRTIRIRGVTHRVVGVAEAAFEFPAGAALWRPLRKEEREDDDRERRVAGSC